MATRKNSKLKKTLKYIAIGIVAAVVLWAVSMLVFSGWLTDTLFSNELHYVMVVTDLDAEELKDTAAYYKKTSLFHPDGAGWFPIQLWEESELYHILLPRGCYFIKVVYGEQTETVTLRVNGKSDVYAVQINFSSSNSYPYLQLHNYADPQAEQEYMLSMIPEDAFYWEGHAYYLISTDNGWQTASDYCESRNAHLATITSQEENDALYEYITEKGAHTVYFGLYDKDETNEGWAWITGEDLDYTNWYEGEPNSSYERYACFYEDFECSQWNDGDDPDDGYDTVYLCEWDYCPEL